MSRSDSLTGNKELAFRRIIRETRLVRAIGAPSVSRLRLVCSRVTKTFGARRTERFRPRQRQIASRWSDPEPGDLQRGRPSRGARAGSVKASVADQLLRKRGRRETNFGRSPSDPAAWPPGLPEDLRTAQRQDEPSDDHGYDVCAALDDQADHQRCRHDAGRCRTSFPRRSRRQIHSLICRSEGGDRGPQCAGRAALRAGCSRASTDDQGSAPANVGHRRGICRRLGRKAL